MTVQNRVLCYHLEYKTYYNLLVDSNTLREKCENPILYGVSHDVLALQYFENCSLMAAKCHTSSQNNAYGFSKLFRNYLTSLH